MKYTYINHGHLPSMSKSHAKKEATTYMADIEVKLK